MATQRETRVVEIVIDAKQFRAAAGRINKNLEDIRQRAINLNTAFRNLFAVFAVYGVQDAIRKLVTFTSELQELDARLRAVVGSADTAAAVFDDLFEVADRTGMRVQDLATMYARLGFATRQMTITHAELKGIVETVANSFRLSGTSAQEASSVAIQFSQALASNRLQGDELRSILENNTVLAQLFADNIDGVNGSLGRLREMGTAGLLDARTLLEALRTGAADVQAQVDGMGLSVQRALNVLENRFSMLVLLMNRSGLGQQISAGILEMADTLERATPGILTALRAILAVGSEIINMFRAVGSAILEASQTIVAAVLRIGIETTAMFDDNATSIKTNQDLWGLFTYTLAVETPVRIRQLTDGFKILWNAIKLGLETLVVEWGNHFSIVGAHVDRAWNTMKAGVLSFFRFLLEQARLKLNEFVRMWTEAAAGVVGFFSDAAAGAIRGAVTAIPETAAETALGLDIEEFKKKADAAKQIITDIEEKNKQFVEDQKQRAADFIESTVAASIGYRGELEAGLRQQEQALKRVNTELDNNIINSGRANEAMNQLAGAGGGGAGGAARAVDEQAKKMKELADAVRSLREELFPAERVMRQYAETVQLLQQALAAGIVTQTEFTLLMQESLHRYREELDQLNNETDKLKETSKDLAQPFISAIDAMINRTKSFSDIIRDLEQALIKAITQILVLGPLQKQLQSSFSSATSGGGGGFLGFIGSVFSAVLGGGAMQMGGPVSPGVPYLVGEAGPEIIVPNTAGMVIPNHELGGDTVNVNVVFSGNVTGEGLRSSAQQIATQVGAQTQRALRRNG